MRLRLRYSIRQPNDLRQVAVRLFLAKQDLQVLVRLRGDVPHLRELEGCVNNLPSGLFRSPPIYEFSGHDVFGDKFAQSYEVYLDELAFVTNPHETPVDAKQVGAR